MKAFEAKPDTFQVLHLRVALGAPSSYDPGGALETVIGPMDAYHSALAVAAFTGGLDIDATLGLYTVQTFAKFAYFDIWESSRSDLLLEDEGASTPLAALFHKWTKGHCCMDSFNHPRLAPIQDMARYRCSAPGLKS